MGPVEMGAVAGATGATEVEGAFSFRGRDWLPESSFKYSLHAAPSSDASALFAVFLLFFGGEFFALHKGMSPEFRKVSSQSL
jgi:hypothetical protein